MDALRIEGSEAAADLLHRVAHGVALGAITVGDATLPCARDVTVVVEVGEIHGTVRTLTVRVGAAPPHQVPLGVEQELAHPGG